MDTRQTDTADTTKWNVLFLSPSIQAPKTWRNNEQDAVEYFCHVEEKCRITLDGTTKFLKKYKTFVCTHKAVEMAIIAYNKWHRTRYKIRCCTEEEEEVEEAPNEIIAFGGRTENCNAKRSAFPPCALPTTQTMLRTNAGPRPRDAGTSNRALRRDNQSGNGESSERYWNVNVNTIILLKFAPTPSPFCHLVPHFRMPREQETILTIERSPPPRRQRTRTPLFIKQNEHTRRLIPVWVFQKKLNGWRVCRHSKL